MLSKPHHPYWDENDFEITATYCILPKAILPPGHEAEEICFDCLLEETKSKGIWVEQ